MNTRFNPTANGRLHLGHLYLVLVNYWSAKRTGGRFVVRFDDDQPYWVARLGRQAITQNCEAIQQDLDWMGVRPDQFSFQSREREANEALMAPLGLMRQHAADGEFFAPQIVGCARPYPYAPYLTAVKVAQDHREGIDAVIRGDDLVTEFSLYCYYCDRLHLAHPKFYYLPKLLHQGSDLCDVSKSDGRFKLSDLRREGYSAKELEALLANCCLTNPGGGWCYENVKRSPTLSMAPPES